MTALPDGCGRASLVQHADAGVAPPRRAWGTLSSSLLGLDALAGAMHALTCRAAP